MRERMDIETQLFCGGHQRQNFRSHVGMRMDMTLLIEDFNQCIKTVITPWWRGAIAFTTAKVVISLMRLLIFTCGAEVVVNDNVHAHPRLRVAVIADAPVTLFNV